MDRVSRFRGDRPLRRLARRGDGGQAADVVRRQVREQGSLQKEIGQALRNMSDRHNVLVKFVGYTDDSPLSQRDERIYTRRAQRRNQARQCGDQREEYDDPAVDDRIQRLNISAGADAEEEPTPVAKNHSP